MQDNMLTDRWQVIKGAHRRQHLVPYTAYIYQQVRRFLVEQGAADSSNHITILSSEHRCYFVGYVIYCATRYYMARISRPHAIDRSCGSARSYWPAGRPVR